jgi:hypothetical protein
MTQDPTLAIAYYTLGAGFQESARVLASALTIDADERPASRDGIPFYFLASHAAELYLKAALLKRGIESSELKHFDYRHNLSALLQKLRDIGVPVSNEASDLIQALSEQHKKHLLRYDVLHGSHKVPWPPCALVFTTLDELLLCCRLSTHGV